MQEYKDYKSNILTGPFITSREMFSVIFKFKTDEVKIGRCRLYS